MRGLRSSEFGSRPLARLCCCVVPLCCAAFVSAGRSNGDPTMRACLLFSNLGTNAPELENQDWPDDGASTPKPSKAHGNARTGRRCHPGASLLLRADCGAVAVLGRRPVLKAWGLHKDKWGLLEACCQAAQSSRRPEQAYHRLLCHS